VSNFAAWLLAGDNPEAIAIVAGDARVTFAELRALVARFAARVADAVPVATPVPIVAQPSIAQVVAYLGTMWAGRVPAPLLPTMPTLREVLAHAGGPLVFADERAEPELRASGQSVERLSLDALDSLPERVAEDVDPARLAALMYTSGSTGRPRGVMVSSNNLVRSTEAILGYLGLTPGDRALSALPLSYCYGASVVHTHLRAGASVVLASLSFPEAFLDLLERERATGLPGVPATFELLLRHSTLRERRHSGLRYLTISGGRLGEDALRDLQAAVPGCAIYVMYGITEVTSRVSYLPPDQLSQRVGSVGRGLPGMPALTVERSDGAQVAPGSDELGEIVVRGPHVALGYFKDPEETAARFVGGAYRTGDLATVDGDGFVYIKGRAREFIKSMGHRVSPEDVEAGLAAVPGLQEVAVFGEPDPLRGEAIVAVVVANADARLALDDLLRAVGDRLPTHMLPSRLRVVARLPRTTNGKIDRRALPAVPPIA
jgi:long-chain acyl-CoA synthetase